MEVRRARTEDYPQPFLGKLDQLEERIGYHFRDRSYLLIALTHSSFSNERETTRDKMESPKNS